MKMREQQGLSMGDAVTSGNGVVRLADRLNALSMRLPCRLIPRDDSMPYMERYLMFYRRGLAGYLHRFVMADADESLHNHPFLCSVAVILRGSYIERRLTAFDESAPQGLRTRVYRRRPWRPMLISKNTWHQIVTVEPETWTLFIHLHKVQRWGFLKPADAQGGMRVELMEESGKGGGNWWDDAAQVRADRAARAPYPCAGADGGAPGRDP